MKKKELADRFLELLNPPRALLAELYKKCMRLKKATLQWKIENLRKPKKGGK